VNTYGEVGELTVVDEEMTIVNLPVCMRMLNTLSVTSLVTSRVRVVCQAQGGGGVASFEGR
jgi:hypothetical protein